MKMIPLSIVIASIVLPVIYSKRPKPKNALKSLQITIAVFAFFWAVANVYIYPKFVFVE